MKKFLFMVMLAMASVSLHAQSEYPTAMTEKHDVAILVIDMQNDFVEPEGKLCVAGAKATIPAINELIQYGRSKNWKVIWIVREHRTSGVDVDAPRIPLFMDGKTGYCVPGTWGGEPSLMDSSLQKMISYHQSTETPPSSIPILTSCSGGWG